MKTFRLYKRGDDAREIKPDAPGYKDRPYYFKFSFRGRRYTRSLETADAAEAQRYARLRYKQITESLIRGEYTRLDANLAAAAVPLERLYTLYRTGPSEAALKTRTTNIHALTQILGPEVTTVPQLTPQAVRRYFETVTTKALDLPQDRAASAKRSANSLWAKAKSLFTPRCLAHYADNGIPVDHLPAFLAAGTLARFTARSVPKIAYNPPGEEIIARTLAAWQDIEDRNLFLAIGHELAFGLRIGELAQARWTWWTTRAGHPVLDGAARVKNGTGQIQVRALDPWYTLLKTKAEARQWIPATPDRDQPIITGSDTYRSDGIFRAVSDWLRQLGWDTMKTNHALRAYAGSQIAMKFGIYEAQMWLRHSTVKVTEQHYTHFVSKFKPADPDAIPVRWATVQTQFIPQILTLPATA